jgi:hypothetical protein
MGYQNRPHLTLHDFPFVEKWGTEKSIFSDFRYFKGITGAIRNGKLLKISILNIQISECLANMKLHYTFGRSFHFLY